MALTPFQLKTVRAILNVFESGQIKSRYDLLVVLKDDAGISFGRSQTTENSGGLHRLLSEYVAASGKFAAQIKQYLPRLYDGKDADLKSEMDEDGTYSGGLTNDQGFKDLLQQAAKEDSILRRAQDRYFHQKYLVPAINYAEEIYVKSALGLAIIYDTSIHSGEHAIDRHFSKAEDGYDEENFDPNNYLNLISSCPYKSGELDDYRIDANKLADSNSDLGSEQRFLLAYLEYRHRWLSTLRGEARKKTVYRMKSLRRLAVAGAWDLKPPFDVWLTFKTVKASEESIQASEW